MAEVWFYHLTRSPVEATLPQLLTRALGTGKRVVVRGPDRARLAWLDERLWLGPEDGFLPHGLSGGSHDADQPILLTDAPETPNGASLLMSIDGADVPVPEAAALDRVFILFDGNDPVALTRARQQWRDLTGAGLAAVYWSEEGGRWEKKLERAASVPTG